MEMKEIEWMESIASGIIDSIASTGAIVIAAVFASTNTMATVGALFVGGLFAVFAIGNAKKAKRLKEQMLTKQ